MNGAHAREGEWRRWLRLLVEIALHFLTAGKYAVVKKGGKLVKVLVGVLLALVFLFASVGTLFGSLGAAVSQSPEFGEMEDFHSGHPDREVGQSAQSAYLIAQLIRGEARLSQGYHGSGNGAGVDIAAAKGTPVLALYDGTVSYYLWMDGNGSLASLGAVAFLRTENTVAIYAHLSGFDTAESMALIEKKPSVQVYAPELREFQYSRTVHKGDVIGYVGSTGYSFGYHLHFGLQVNGRPVNPLSVELEDLEEGA